MPRHRARTSVRLGDALRIPEFRALWTAETLSVAGDQLARVALAVLVFQRTGSAAATGLTYALTFLPAFVGGALFGGLGDRYPRRTVVIVADVGRAALIAVAAVPGVPLWVLCVLVGGTTLLTGPFKAAQQAMLPGILGERYASGMALRNVSMQAAQLVGFGAGGALVEVLRPSIGLSLDAATFALSALLVFVGVRGSPAAATVRVSLLASMTAGARTVRRDPALRALLGLCWLAGFYVVPEALAAPYAAQLGGGALAVGAIMASDPFGSVVGGIVFGKWVPEKRQRQVIGLLGIVAGLPLVACLARPPLVVSMAMFAVCGACATAYNIRATAEYVQRLPEHSRAQGSGLLSTGLITVQGVGALLAGVLADHLSPSATVAVAGAAGALAAVPSALAWARVVSGRRRDRPTPANRTSEAAVAAPLVSE